MRCDSCNITRKRFKYNEPHRKNNLCLLVLSSVGVPHILAHPGLRPVYLKPSLTSLPDQDRFLDNTHICYLKPYLISSFAIVDTGLALSPVIFSLLTRIGLPPIGGSATASCSTGRPSGTSLGNSSRCALAAVSSVVVLRWLISRCTNIVDVYQSAIPLLSRVHPFPAYLVRVPRCVKPNHPPL